MNAYEIFEEIRRIAEENEDTELIEFFNYLNDKYANLEEEEILKWLDVVTKAEFLATLMKDEGMLSCAIIEKVYITSILEAISEDTEIEIVGGENND